MRSDRQRTWWACGLAVVLPLVVAAALVPLRHRIDNANVALLLAAAVVIVAVLGHRLAVVLAACSAAAWFDFFHTKPFDSFTIANRDDAVTAGVLLVVGVIVGELAIRGRRHRVQSEERRDDIGRIHAIAELVSSGEPAAQIVMVVAMEIRELLELRGCRYEPVLGLGEEVLTATLERDGRVMMGDLEWGAASTGLPGKRVDVGVHDRGRLVGRFILEPTPASPVSLERRIVAVALADQVGAAVGLANRPVHRAG